MKKHITYLLSAVFLIFSVFSAISCKKKDNQLLYEKGFFPDTVVALAGLNTVYDDYNANLNTLDNYLPIVFSSNRSSTGGQFDLVQGVITYSFDQTTGDFQIQSDENDDTFFRELITRFNTDKNEFGPYRLYSALDGNEYTIVSSVNDNGNLDFRYVKNLPYFGSVVPSISGPFPATKLNSSADDAYFCFDTNQDSAYYTTNSDGNFNICLIKRSSLLTIDDWLNSSFETPLKVDVLNSINDDKCPFIYRKIMVFTSDRPGGFGGFDLYYSQFKNGSWATPVNMGETINTASDEYRPLLSGDENFTNMYLIFSSNRPGGKGGFDLYFTGIEFK